MEVIIEQIKEEEKRVVLSSSPLELEVNLDLATLSSDVEYHVSHRRVENELFLNGPVIFNMEITCARCLEKFEKKYKPNLDLIIQLVEDESLIEEDSADEHFVLYPASNKTYNLNQHIIDLVTLEIPLKPICKSDCRGLCSQCGTNLNLNSCKCKVKETDARWDKLKSFTENHN